MECEHCQGKRASVSAGDGNSFSLEPQSRHALASRIPGGEESTGWSDHRLLLGVALEKSRDDRSFGWAESRGAEVLQRGQTRTDGKDCQGACDPDVLGAADRDSFRRGGNASVCLGYALPAPRSSGARISHFRDLSRYAEIPSGRLGAAGELHGEAHGGRQDVQATSGCENGPAHHHLFIGPTKAVWNGERRGRRHESELRSTGASSLGARAIERVGCQSREWQPR